MFSPVTNDARPRGTQRSFARRLYPLVSTPAFLGLSLIVIAALMLTVVALILIAVLRFAVWIAGSVIFVRRDEATLGNQQSSALDKENVS